MNNDLLDLLDSVLGTHSRQSTSEYYWHCPFCSHRNPKLAINLNKGKWHCWVCNQSGNKLISLFKKLNCSRQQIIQLLNIIEEDNFTYLPLQNNSIESLTLPQEYSLLLKPNKKFEYKHAINYIKSRNLTELDIIRYQLGYCIEGTYQNRIIIPSYDKNNKLNYFIARSFFNEKLKYKNPKVSKDIIPFANHINWNYPIVLCEGVFDAMTIKTNAIPLLGKTVSTELMKQIITSGIKDIYLALDSDALINSIDLAISLNKENRNVYIVSLDAKDPSEIGFIGMKRAIKQASKLSFSELVRLKINATSKKNNSYSRYTHSII